MIIADQISEGTIELANIPTSGSLGSAATTVDLGSSFLLNQTTANISITSIAAPTDNTSGRIIELTNKSSTISITILGLLLNPKNSCKIKWMNANWNLCDNPKISKTIFIPLTGDTINIPNNKRSIINPSGTLATLVLNLPTTPNDCDRSEERRVGKECRSRWSP